MCSAAIMDRLELDGWGANLILPPRTGGFPAKNSRSKNAVLRRYALNLLVNSLEFASLVRITT
jgi:hypothetical protein